MSKMLALCLVKRTHHHNYYCCFYLFENIWWKETFSNESVVFIMNVSIIHFHLFSVCLSLFVGNQGVLFLPTNTFENVKLGCYGRFSLWLKKLLEEQAVSPPAKQQCFCMNMIWQIWDYFHYFHIPIPAIVDRIYWTLKTTQTIKLTLMIPFFLLNFM